jgi:sugar lactone lactonase YvrE
VAIATGQSGPVGIVSDGTYVVWGNTDGTMWRANVDGSSPALLSSSTTGSWIALDDQEVFFGTGSSSNPTGIAVMPLLGDGGTILPLLSGSTFTQIALDPTYVYVGDYVNGTVTQVPRGGGMMNVIVSGADQPDGVAVDSQNVYFGTQAGGYVGQAPITSTGSFQQIMSGVGAQGGIAVYGGAIYVTSFGANEVLSVPIGGGTVTTVAASQDYPYGLAVDSSGVYWTNYEGGTIACAAAGKGVSTLATGQGHPYFIATDSTAIYWTANTDGNVMRLAK